MTVVAKFNTSLARPLQVGAPLRARGLKWGKGRRRPGRPHAAAPAQGAAQPLTLAPRPSVSAAQSLLLQWILLVFDLIESKENLHNLYGVLFFWIEYETLVSPAKVHRSVPPSGCLLGALNLRSFLFLCPAAAPLPPPVPSHAAPGWYVSPAPVDGFCIGASVARVLPLFSSILVLQAAKRPTPRPQIYPFFSATVSCPTPDAPATASGALVACACGAGPQPVPLAQFSPLPFHRCPARLRSSSAGLGARPGGAPLVLQAALPQHGHAGCQVEPHGEEPRPCLAASVPEPATASDPASRCP